MCSGIQRKALAGEDIGGNYAMLHLHPAQIRLNTCQQDLIVEGFHDKVVSALVEG